MDADSFQALMRRMEEARHRPVRDVIESDAATPMGDDELDDALWLALCGRVDSAHDLAGLPDGVRMYYATHMVEYDVGNGGFEHSVDCAAEYYEEAIAGYRLLGDDASVELLQRAQALAHDPAALEALTHEVDGPPWHGVPWGDAARLAYVREHRDKFLI
jgi:hypothetical protein